MNKQFLRWARYGAIFALACGLAACDRSPSIDRWAGAAKLAVQMFTPKHLPNPVQRKDGMAYIPIEDTAFLIPEKTWLVSFGRRSTDGMVDSFILHATVPDVQPWSQERNDEMYWRVGPGKKLLIYIWGDRVNQIQRFYRVPNSISPFDFIEEPSGQTAQELRQFREIWLSYNEKNAGKDAAKFGNDYVEKRRVQAGKPMTDNVFYELIENNRVKYFIRCGDTWNTGQLFQSCHLFFPITKFLMVDIYFMRDEINHAVAMADKVNNRLHEFEAAGLAYRAAQSTLQPPSFINH